MREDCKLMYTRAYRFGISASDSNAIVYRAVLLVKHVFKKTQNNCKTPSINLDVEHVLHLQP